MTAPVFFVDPCTGTEVELVATSSSAAEVAETCALAAAAAAEGETAVPLLLEVLTRRAGRIVWNGFPTGVAVAWGMHHGGPYPSSTSPAHTSVGPTAIRRFLRPVTYQSAPQELLPPALQEGNPLGIPRRVGGVLQLP